MKYDFTSQAAPRGTNSVKWDSCDPDVIPMWVAEMDFPVAPFIADALHRRIDKGVFGYTHVPDSYYSSVTAWFGGRYGWNISREQIIPISGIVPAISVVLKALSPDGPHKVIIHSPAYNCFFSSIRNTGCSLSASVLQWDGATHRYTVDWDDFERRCSEPGVSAFLLCNPHNPTGRLWSREELTRMGEICLRHGIPVISDEIHCEICAPGTAYTPFASICPEFAQNSVSFVSPTKAFNIAGLQVANIVSANASFRERIERVINDWEHCDVNQLGIVALEAAYTDEGAEWLDEMNAVVHRNFVMLRELFAKRFPAVRVPELEATYLLWLDFSGMFGPEGVSSPQAGSFGPPPASGSLPLQPRAAMASGEDTPSGDISEIAGRIVAEHLLEKARVRISDGSIYGDPRCCRMNLACPEATMREALRRIAG